MKLLPWLLTAEAIALAATLMGLLITLITGEAIYTLFPLVIVVLLNSWHRRFGDRQNRRGTIEALRRQRQELREEIEQLRQAPPAPASPPPDLATPASDTTQLLEAIVLLQEHNQRLDQGLRQVVKALNPVLPQPVTLNTPPSPQKITTAPHWQRGPRFTAHEGWVNALDIRADGHILATGGNDQKLCLWNLTTGTLAQAYTLPAPVSALAFDPVSDFLASGGYDHRIQLWHCPDGDLENPNPGHSEASDRPPTCTLKLNLEDHDGSVQTLIFVPGYLVSGSYDQRIRIWDLGAILNLEGSVPSSTHSQSLNSVALEGHEGSVQCLAFDRERSCLYSGSEDGQILRWHFPTGELLGTLASMTCALECLTISPGGTYLIAGCSDGTLRVWQLASGTLLYILEAHTGPLTALTIAGAGQTLISGGADGRLKLWHLPTGEAWGNLAEPVDAILDLRYCPHRKHLMSTHPGGQVQIWNEVLR